MDSILFLKKRVMDRVIERGKTGSGNGLSLHSHAVAEAKGNSKFRLGYRRWENVGEGLGCSGLGEGARY